jgi:hypothetical protein
VKPTKKPIQTPTPEMMEMARQQNMLRQQGKTKLDPNSKYRHVLQDPNDNGISQVLGTADTTPGDRPDMGIFPILFVAMSLPVVAGVVYLLTRIVIFLINRKRTKTNPQDSSTQQ